MRFIKFGRGHTGALLLCACVQLAVANQAYAQAGSPLPGSNGLPQSTVPTAANINPSANETIPLPGGEAIELGQRSALQSQPSLPQLNDRIQEKSRYRRLPISEADAKTRLAELKTLLFVTRPESIQTDIDNLCEWLADLADAHNKLANVFSRQEETRAYAVSERFSAQRLGQLKDEAVLLKAEVLIKLNRAVEALAPLVEIVVHDPKGTTGQKAYAMLKDLGFSVGSEIASTHPSAHQSVQPLVLPTNSSSTSKKALPAKHANKSASSLVVASTHKVKRSQTK